MVKLKIIHFSDLHNGHKQLEALRGYINAKSDIDLVVLSGDILGPCLNGSQAQKVHEDLEIIIEACKKEFETSKDLHKILKSCEQKGGKVRDAAKSYEEIERRFDEISRDHYDRFSNEIRGINPQVLMIPGNWDSPVEYMKKLEKYNIHGTTAKLEDFVIAGYGGADFVPKFMPPSRYMPYNEEELGKFLEKAAPDIIVSHVPPKGVLDGENKLGSQKLRDYIKKERPMLVLCGHEHTPGVEVIDGTTIVNAGNLGKYFNQETYGTFAEIEIDDERVKVTYYQIDDRGQVNKLEKK